MSTSHWLRSSGSHRVRWRWWLSARLDGLHAGALVDSSGSITGSNSDWVLSVLHQKTRR